ncbi:hypothetical protein BX661DRAFT_188539 [Kickxella alabastrina]|uniref:uncharacterized protein n=1 Tax=Kickxella alabastrina TaxID=61397 RepID=UPI002220292F|nr:uncharacterized protein BX661DRAFT_188539 [Kickxella alabastrina]KAI7821295.1 hypothetical protein BX661DRAFT_188539 [Kickxella alabastrina]
MTTTAINTEPNTPDNQQQQLARIKFRVSDGRTSTGEFDTNTTLSELRTFIESNLNMSRNNTEISQRIPAQVFDKESDARTLKDLGLTPTATLLLCNWEQRRQEAVKEKEIPKPKPKALDDDDLVIEDYWNVVNSKTYLYVYAAVIVALGIALTLFLTPSKKDSP